MSGLVQRCRDSEEFEEFLEVRLSTLSEPPKSARYFVPYAPKNRGDKIVFTQTVDRQKGFLLNVFRGCRKNILTTSATPRPVPMEVLTESEISFQFGKPISSTRLKLQKEYRLEQKPLYAKSRLGGFFNVSNQHLRNLYSASTGVRLREEANNVNNIDEDNIIIDEDNRQYHCAATAEEEDAAAVTILRGEEEEAAVKISREEGGVPTVPEEKKAASRGDEFLLPMVPSPDLFAFHTKQRPLCDPGEVGPVTRATAGQKWHYSSSAETQEEPLKPCWLCRLFGC